MHLKITSNYVHLILVLNHYINFELDRKLPRSIGRTTRKQRLSSFKWTILLLLCVLEPTNQQISSSCPTTLNLVSQLINLRDLMC